VFASANLKILLVCVSITLISSSGPNFYI
jgi:hypothetical protein